MLVLADLSSVMLKLTVLDSKNCQANIFRTVQPVFENSGQFQSGKIWFSIIFRKFGLIKDVFEKQDLRLNHSTDFSDICLIFKPCKS